MMFRTMAALGLTLGLVVPAWGQPAGASLADQVKKDPNNTDLINKYVGSGLQSAFRLAAKDPDKGLKIMDELTATIDQLKPDKPDAKRLVMYAKVAITRYRKQIELQRISIDDIVKKLNEKLDAETVGMYGMKIGQQVGPLARSEPEKAEKTINEAKAFLDALLKKAEGDKDVTQAIDKAASQLGRFERTIAAAKKLKELIGKDATALTADAWVNGEPLTAEDLKGKVVLLDFWAVWCGPCVSTFPHLIEWNEKYADKGLVIVGLTGYYNFIWDDKGETAKPSDDKVTPADEQEMLKKFAAHHKLKHRFAVNKSRDLSEFYGVTGIPHVVVIDRHGKIRLIKVGAGESNAKEIEDMLEKLLAEKA